MSAISVHSENKDKIPQNWVIYWKYKLTIFHTISEGEKDTSQAAECCLKAQICLFFKWYKQPFFANIVFLSPGLVTKTEELPNMKGVNQRFKYAF